MSQVKKKTWGEGRTSTNKKGEEPQRTNLVLGADSDEPRGKKESFVKESWGGGGVNISL